MASARLGEELDCSICLGTYSEPVMLDCGHNFCCGCISSVLDCQGSPYHCPECRTGFRKRPKLMRNLKLCNIVELFRSAEPGNTEIGLNCNFCVDDEVPAVKTCLFCEVSLCFAHLGAHSKTEEHVLTEPTSSPKDRRCSVHKKILEYYCLEDATCVCVTCLVAGEHKCHQVQLVDEATHTKQEQLGEALQTLNWRMDDIARSRDTLDGRKRELHLQTARVTETFAGFIDYLRKQVDELEKRGCGEISSREEDVLAGISARVRELDIKAEKVQSTMLGVENLRNITDPWTLLKMPFDGVDDIEDDLDETAQITLDEAALTDVLRERCKAFSVAAFYLEARSHVGVQEILLDSNTAGNSVIVSHDLKRITYSGNRPTRPEAPERFTACQAISVGDISKGQYYWEVETSEKGDWKIGVTYLCIERKGSASFIGANKKSWCMARSAKEFVATHNSISKVIRPVLDVCQYGIFLNYSAGQVSFYLLSDPIEHLYTFTAAFTEPLHPAFYVGVNAWVRILSCGDGCPTKIALVGNSSSRAGLSHGHDGAASAGPVA